MSRVGIVAEGGGTKAAYSAGVLKCLLEHDIVLPYCVGISAGTEILLSYVSKEMIASMNEKAIVFPMANPVPEIEPDDAKEAGAYIVGTGRSDHPNQINNVLAFPGIFKGALKAGATCINDAMKEAAVYAISSMVTEDMLDSEHIIVSALDPRVADVVAQAVADAAKESGVVRE